MADKRNGVSVRELAPLILRQFFPQEVPLLFEIAGLEVTACYGDFLRNPLTGASPNQIYLGRRPTGSSARPASLR